ncbi:MAG: hypothetical protein HQ538_02030 [Parcubacteria group bacterium]|nr:hypothetical protein [Parcubacteria group bacterium]
MKIIQNIYLWTQENDLPNWIIIIFSLIVWPIILYLWNQRTINNIPNLQISLTKGASTINGERKENFIWINFLNNAGSIIYLTNTRILKCSKLFQVDPRASRDIAESSHELKFPNKKDNILTERQIILQTNEESGSGIQLKYTISDDMLTFQSKLWRRLLRKPKYFSLEYIVMVGNKRYKVRTIY